MSTRELVIARHVGYNDAFKRFSETIDEELRDIHTRLNELYGHELTSDKLGLFNILTGQLIEAQKIQNIVIAMQHQFKEVPEENNG
jgi:hypothetical protein